MTAEELVALAQDVARVIADGGGSAAVARRLAEATGSGVLIEDASHHPLARAGAPDAAASGGEDTPPFVTPIATGQTLLGRICLFGEDAQDFAHAARLAASSLAIDLARASAGEGASRTSFWEHLIAGRFTDAITARDEAAARGIGLAPHYVVAVLECTAADGCASDRAVIRSAIREAFKPTSAQIELIERAAAYVVCIPAARAIDASKARTAATMLPRSLAKRVPDICVSGGVSEPAVPIDVPQALARADAALVIARRLFGSGKVAVYDELGAYALLYRGAATDALRDFAARTLAPLRAYDEKHQTELEKTLRLYFDLGQNVKSAAQALHVHRHTVFYRLRQIGELCGCRLESPHDQLTLRMAVAIDALHS